MLLSGDIAPLVCFFLRRGYLSGICFPSITLSLNMVSWCFALWNILFWSQSYFPAIMIFLERFLSQSVFANSLISSFFSRRHREVAVSALFEPSLQNIIFNRTVRSSISYNPKLYPRLIPAISILSFHNPLPSL